MSIGIIVTASPRERWKATHRLERIVKRRWNAYLDDGFRNAILYGSAPPPKEPSLITPSADMQALIKVTNGA